MLTVEAETLSGLLELELELLVVSGLPINTILFVFLLISAKQCLFKLRVISLRFLKNPSNRVSFQEELGSDEYNDLWEQHAKPLLLREVALLTLSAALCACVWKPHLNG